MRGFEYSTKTLGNQVIDQILESSNTHIFIFIITKRLTCQWPTWLFGRNKNIMAKDIKRIAVFTSGGDAPGMNAAVRAIVRNAFNNDLHIYGIMRGYEGMIDGTVKRLETNDVGNIIHRGGTILKTARSQRFMTPEGRKQAYENLIDNDIDALIAIGGNGTFAGASLFTKRSTRTFQSLAFQYH